MADFSPHFPYGMPAAFDGSAFLASDQSVAAAAMATEACHTFAPSQAQYDMESPVPAFGPYFTEPKEPLYMWDQVDALCSDQRAPRWAAMCCIGALVAGASAALALYLLRVF